MEAVHVLAVVNSLDNLLLRDVLWQRQLDDESVYIGILVEFVNLGKKLLFGDVVLEAEKR